MKLYYIVNYIIIILHSKLNYMLKLICVFIAS